MIYQNYKRTRRFFCTTVTFLAVLITAPVLCLADVFISEIAWMGSANGGADSANASDEWIELQNSGTESVNVEGWHLFINDKSIGTPTSAASTLPPLTGVIPAGGFYLLERTSDSSVPSITADFIYTGSLSNTGATITLKDAHGVLVNQVNGGDNWGDIGGDNTTKYTPQKTASGWKTGQPTPKAPFVAEAFSGGSQSQSNNQNNPPPTATTTSSSSFSSGAVSRAPVEPQIFVFINGDKSAIVGVESIFKGTTFGLDKKPIEGARYLWSFGDGTVKEGQTVAHAWRMPGNYLVVLEVSSGEFNATNRQKISVVEANVSIAKIEGGKTGSIAVKNGLTDDMNLSRWGLRSRGQTFNFPSPTVILAGTTVYFTNEITGLDPDPAATELLYPNGLVATKFSPAESKPLAVAQALVSTKQISKPDVQNNPPKSPSFPIVKKGDSKSPASASSELVASTSVIYSAAVTKSGVSSDWILALVGVVGIGGLGVLFSMKPKAGEANLGQNTGENGKLEEGEQPLRAEEFEIIEERDTNPRIRANNTNEDKE